MRRIILMMLCVLLLFGNQLFAMEPATSAEDYYVESSSDVDYNNFLREQIEDSIFIIRVQGQYEIALNYSEREIRRYKASAEQRGAGIAIGGHFWTLYHIVHPNRAMMAPEVGVTKRNYYAAPPQRIIRETFSIIDPNEESVFVDVEEVYANRDLDISIFKYPRNSFVKEFPIKIGDPEKLKHGDYLEICGRPMGLKRVVCREARVRLIKPLFYGDFDEDSYFDVTNTFVVEGDIYPGDSGSPVFAFNREGKPELVGVAQAIRTDIPTLAFILRIDEIKWWFDAMVGEESADFNKNPE